MKGFTHRAPTSAAASGAVVNASLAEIARTANTAGTVAQSTAGTLTRAIERTIELAHSQRVSATTAGSRRRHARTLDQMAATTGTAAGMGESSARGWR